MVRAQGICKTFVEGGQPRPVLRDLSLTLGPGELVALVGRSGSGKSTLLNVLAGIDLPDSGSVIIDKMDVTALTERDRTLFRRDHIGFVFQFFNLLPTLTVLENVLLPLELGGRGRDGRATEQARALLGSVGLADRGKAFPDRLSGGEQQRVAIARALIAEPALILADEPTGNLDAETGAAVLQLLVDLARRHGRTVLVVTHSEDVAGLADRVLRLDVGRLRDDR